MVKSSSTVQFVAIERKGMVAKLASGVTSGDQRYPLSSISAVNFKAATVMNTGYVQFLVGGVRTASRGGMGRSVSDELEFSRQPNVVTFKKKSNDEFAALRDAVDAALAAPAGASTAPAAEGLGVAEEIERLSALRASGDLTDEEFAALKAKLLS